MAVQPDKRAQAFQFAEWGGNETERFRLGVWTLTAWRRYTNPYELLPSLRPAGLPERHRRLAEPARRVDHLRRERGALEPRVAAAVPRMVGCAPAMPKGARGVRGSARLLAAQQSREADRRPDRQLGEGLRHRGGDTHAPVRAAGGVRVEVQRGQGGVAAIAREQR
jgi:hypothetical protein